MAFLTIDPGRLRVELSLEEATQAPDGAGGFTESWAEVALVFAEIEPLAARDRPVHDGSPPRSRPPACGRARAGRAPAHPA